MYFLVALDEAYFEVEIFRARLKIPGRKMVVFYIIEFSRCWPFLITNQIKVCVIKFGNRIFY